MHKVARMQHEAPSLETQPSATRMLCEAACVDNSVEKTGLVVTYSLCHYAWVAQALILTSEFQNKIAFRIKAF